MMVGRGRPRLPDGSARYSYLRVRVSDRERGLIQKSAEADGLSVSEWVRKKLLADLPDSDKVGHVK